MMPALLIAIEPPQEIKENIIKLRKYFTKKIGKNIYGAHEPHITLFVNSFSSFSDVENRIIKVIRKQSPFSIKIKGLHTFLSDPQISDSHTIVYAVERTPKLAKLQKNIVTTLNPIRTNDQTKWMLEQNPKLSENKNIKKYGYPFGPEDWIFHASIGAVPKNKYERIWGKIQKYDLSKAWQVKAINLYIHIGDEGFVFFRKYKF
jgi:2'-5' RNA ligase